MTLAPTATRTAISRCRSAARASSRFARFAHTISSTNPTVPSNSSMPLRTLPVTCSLKQPRVGGIALIELRILRRQLLRSGGGSPRRACACVTPGRRSATTFK